MDHTKGSTGSDPKEEEGASTCSGQGSFADLVHHFFELREKGSSLSPADLAVLAKWQSLGLDPAIVAQEMSLVKAECIDSGALFPLTLTGLEKMMNRLRHRYGEAFRWGGAHQTQGHSSAHSSEGKTSDQQDSATDLRPA